MKNIAFIIISMLFFLLPAANGQGCMEPSGDEGVQVIGFIQPQFEYGFYGEESFTGESLDENSFYFNRARLGVMGTIPYDFSYYFMTELSPTLNGKKDANIPILLDAFISYNRFAPYAKLSIGQFKSPFGLELMTPCHKLHTIRRSAVVEQLAHPWRDQGLMLSGGTGNLSFLGSKTENFIGYSFAVMNGSGLNQWDDDKMKDFVGRLSIHPVDFLTIGASYRWGESSPKAEGVTENDVRERIGFDAEIKYKNFLLQGEYIKGIDEGSSTVGGGCGGTVETVLGSFKKEGFFAQALYMTPWNIQPVVKFERYDPDLAIRPGDGEFSTDNAIRNTITYGVNYFFNEWTRVQINYLYNAEENGNVEVENDALLFQVQVVF